MKVKSGVFAHVGSLLFSKGSLIPPVFRHHQKQTLRCRTLVSRAKLNSQQQLCVADMIVIIHLSYRIYIVH